MRGGGCKVEDVVSMWKVARADKEIAIVVVGRHGLCSGYGAGREHVVRCRCLVRRSTVSEAGEYEWRMRQKRQTGI